MFKKWKERYELAIIASNDGLWDMNLKTKEIFFSNKWLDMFGYNRNDIQNFEQWLSLVHKDDKQNVLFEYEKHNNQEFNQKKIDDLKNQLLEIYPNILEGYLCKKLF